MGRKQESNSTGLGSVISDLRGNLTATQANLTIAKSRVLGLETQLNTTQIALTTLKESSSICINDLATAQKNLTIAEVTIAALGRDNTTFSSKAEACETELSDLKESTSNAATDLTSAQSGLKTAHDVLKYISLEEYNKFCYLTLGTSGAEVIITAPSLCGLDASGEPQAARLPLLASICLLADDICTDRHQEHENAGSSLNLTHITLSGEQMSDYCVAINKPDCL